MVRRIDPALQAGRGSPHVRGDGPESPRDHISEESFSPRAWGWSEFTFEIAPALRVLPTCVGMVRGEGIAFPHRDRSPHVRGDGPMSEPRKRSSKTFSPRAWGWSVGVFHATAAVAVLPTCVGMVRCTSKNSRSASRSPHVRGDGPPARSPQIQTRWFSPRAWGWSAVLRLDRLQALVLPTCVGMVPEL